MKKNERRATTKVVTPTPATATVKPTAKHDDDFDFDFDKRVADQVDWSIWRAIYNGRFRLAVQCDTCGRWLTAGASKKAHRGPRCAAKTSGDDQ